MMVKGEKEWLFSDADDPLVYWLVGGLMWCKSCHEHWMKLLPTGNLQKLLFRLQCRLSRLSIENKLHRTWRER